MNSKSSKATSKLDSPLTISYYNAFKPQNWASTNKFSVAKITNCPSIEDTKALFVDKNFQTQHKNGLNFIIFEIVNNLYDITPFMETLHQSLSKMKLVIVFEFEECSVITWGIKDSKPFYYLIITKNGAENTLNFIYEFMFDNVACKSNDGMLI